MGRRIETTRVNHKPESKRSKSLKSKSLQRTLNKFHDSGCLNGFWKGTQRSQETTIRQIYSLKLKIVRTKAQLTEQESNLHEGRDV